MEQVKLIGMGCFGKPDRVARLIDKLVRHTRPVYDIQAGLDGATGLDPQGILGFYVGFSGQSLNLSLCLRQDAEPAQRVYRRMIFPRRGALN